MLFGTLNNGQNGQLNEIMKVLFPKHRAKTTPGRKEKRIRKRTWTIEGQGRCLMGVPPPTVHLTQKNWVFCNKADSTLKTIVIFLNHILHHLFDDLLVLAAILQSYNCCHLCRGFRRMSLTSSLFSSKLSLGSLGNFALHLRDGIFHLSLIHI